nr:hypothetical protein [Burkholderiaceae bacterium]
MTPTPQTQPQVCARCAADNPAGNRFCGQCGQALMPAAATTGERRPLTVVFCDLVASATLSARLDAEDLSGLLADYHRVCSAAVERHDGHIAQYLG